MSAAILAAVRSRLAAAYPGATDLSEEPDAVDRRRVPAYAVEVNLAGSEVATIGPAAEVEESLDVRVSFWREKSGPADFAAALRVDAASIRAAVLGDPRDLGDLVFDIVPTSEDVEIERADRRVGRVDVAFEARRIAPIAGGA